MFRKIVLTVLVLGLMSGVAFAVPQTDNVVVNNTGNAGNIFVSTGTSQGNNQIGTWADGSSFKGEKGNTGNSGLDGKDGYTPIKGIDYNDGKNGEQGVAGTDGKTPVKDVDYTDGKNGDKGDTGSKGDKGQQGIQGERGKGLEDRVELIGEVRILDTKRTTWSIYAGRDINNGVGIYGAKVTVKLGRSYEERRLDALEKKLNLLEATPDENVTVVPTATGFKVQVIK